MGGHGGREELEGEDPAAVPGEGGPLWSPEPGALLCGSGPMGVEAEGRPGKPLSILLLVLAVASIFLFHFHVTHLMWMGRVPTIGRWHLRSE